MKKIAAKINQKNGKTYGGMGFFRAVSFCLYLFQASSAFVYRVMGAVVGDGERIESAREKTGRAGEGFGFGGVMRQIAMSLAANGDTTLIK